MMPILTSAAHLEDVVLARDAAFAFPAVHFPDFFAIEFQSRAGATTILGNEHHARGFQRCAQAPPRGLVRGTKALLEVGDRLNIDGRGLRELLLRPLDERAASTTLRGGKGGGSSDHGSGA